MGFLDLAYLTGKQQINQMKIMAYTPLPDLAIHLNIEDRYLSRVFRHMPVNTRCLQA